MCRMWVMLRIERNTPVSLKIGTARCEIRECDVLWVRWLTCSVSLFVAMKKKFSAWLWGQWAHSVFLSRLTGFINSIEVLVSVVDDGKSQHQNRILIVLSMWYLRGTVKVGRLSYTQTIRKYVRLNFMVNKQFYIKCCQYFNGNIHFFHWNNISFR